MKIGYACINRSIGCSANRTFRLASYSKEKFLETVKENLDCLQKILEYNKKNELLFFRISSDIIPFASHEICDVDWKEEFKESLQKIGAYIKSSEMRISMHPDQFVVLNSTNEEIVKKSVAELSWQCEFLDSLGLEENAKVQIHVGGVYGDKESAMKRFIENYKKLPDSIRKRLVIENDDRLYSLQDCLNIHSQIHIPIIFDNLHHDCLNNNETLRDALILASKTWKEKDGFLMCDYSSQEIGERKGKHARTIDEKHFKNYLQETQNLEFDIMLEIKDKEPSALKAQKVKNEIRK